MSKMWSTYDFQMERRQRVYELIKKYNLRIAFPELATQEMLEQAVIIELLDKHLSSYFGFG